MERKRKNPWQGLKSYSEGKVLYGRDKEIVELSQKILYNTQTIIYGRSGIGKSSLLKAGVFPVLRKHNLFPVYIRLSHSEKDDYGYASQVFDAVEKSLSELRVENFDSEAGYDVVSGYKEETIPVVNEHAEGLWEYFHRHRFFYKPVGEEEPVQITPVLVFDQFEELFTLQEDRAKMLSLFKELEFLLNDVCPDELLQQGEQEGSAAEGSVKSGSLIKTAVSFKVRENRYLKGNNFHLVMSVREDFLSHLERNSTNIPSLKHNRYCLLPLSEDRAAEVIMKPVPGLVSLQVAKEIISKVTGVPVTDFEIDDNPELEVDSAILSLFLSELYAKKGTDEPAITLAMVEKFGSNIISDFYQETMEHISKPSVEYLERRLVTKEGRRDAIYWEQALRHNVTQKELDFLLGQRLLHRYSWRDGIRVEFSHDILCPIISKRRKERESEAERAKARRTKRILMLSLALSLLCVGGLVYWYIYSEKKYQKEYVDECVEIYADFVECNTWPKGIKRITAEEASHLSRSFWFYKKGTKAKHPYRMEVRDGYGQLTSYPDLFSYDVLFENLMTSELSKRLGAVVCFEYVSDADGEFCILMKARDVDDKEIYHITNYVNKEEKSCLQAFTDPRGYPLAFKNNTLVCLRAHMDENGYVKLCAAYDQNGHPIEFVGKVYKVATVNSPNGITMDTRFLFFDDTLTSPDSTSLVGNRVLKTTDDGFKPLIEAWYNKEGYVAEQKLGYSVSCYDYDEYGRRVQEKYYRVPLGIKVDSLLPSLERGEDLLDECCIDSTEYHSIVTEYNERGLETKISFMGIYDEPVFVPIDFVGNASTIERAYDADGNLMSEKWVLKDGELISLFEYIKDRQIPWEQYKLDIKNDTVWYVRHYYEDGLIIKEEYGEDLKIITKYDKSYELLDLAVYDRNDMPATIEDGNIHSIKREIENSDGVCKATLTHYDINNNPLNVKDDDLGIYYYKSVEVIDSIDCTYSCEYYYLLDMASPGMLSDFLYNSYKYIYKDSSLSYITHYIDNDGIRKKLIYSDNNVSYFTASDGERAFIGEDIGHVIVDASNNRVDNADNYSSYLDGKYYNANNEPVYDTSSIYMLNANTSITETVAINDIIVAVDDVVYEYNEETKGNLMDLFGILCECDVEHRLLMYNEKGKYIYQVDLPRGKSIIDDIGERVVGKQEDSKAFLSSLYKAIADFLIK